MKTHRPADQRVTRNVDIIADNIISNARRQYVLRAMLDIC
jgi:hypothetical protein